MFTYLSYCLFFPSVMIGPTFKYSLFEEFINNKPQQTPPIKQAMYDNLLTTVGLTLLTGLLMPIFHSYWFITNPTFTGLPGIVQFLCLNLIGPIYRMKFYMAWGYTQMSINLTGLSWNKETKEYDLVSCGSMRF